MARAVLVFQHSPWEGPGAFLLAAAKEHKIALRVCRVWEEDIPPPEEYAALIVLGGGPNVDQEHLYPFLTEEKKVIRKSLSRDIPYLGFCLGHQLLADALGATVGPNHQASIGFIDGFLTHDGRSHPAFKELPQRMPLFKWHGHAVKEPLPGHISILVTSPECQVEAISVYERPHILGLQFDNHAAAPENVSNWLVMDSKWLATLPNITIDSAILLNEARKYETVIRDQFLKLFDNFFALIH